MAFNQRHRVKRPTMGIRLHFILMCASSLLEASTYGYRIPPRPPPPFLDLDILRNTANHFQDVGTVPYGMYPNNLPPSTQKILHTLLQEIVKLDMLSKEQSNYNWRKLVSIVKIFHMKFLASYDFRPILLISQHRNTFLNSCHSQIQNCATTRYLDRFKKLETSFIKDFSLGWDKE